MAAPDYVANAKLLVVGAGGIGCELLKTLAQSGYRNIQVVDLDTIDVSNLNRQFLFRKQHVGQSKALVASRIVREIHPSCEITAHHGNIKDEKFDKDFFASFDLCLNALDNVQARQHVNRMCLACEIPLVDSGTMGYVGQSNVIVKGETLCYDCLPKNEPIQRFPICTIRSTPDKPVHCIVWAKELFKLLFGKRSDSDLVDLEIPDQDKSGKPGSESNGSDSKEVSEEERAAHQQELKARSVIMDAVTSLAFETAVPTVSECAAYTERVFDAVFFSEIQSKLSIKGAQKPNSTSRPSPRPLRREELAQLDAAHPVDASSGARELASQRVWSLQECLEHLRTSVTNMLRDPAQRAKLGRAEFDKDDPVSLEFVAAASNLRCFAFHIERKSSFDVQGIAGNIVHAVATTNAIAAGLQVLEATRVLKRKSLNALPLSKDSRLTFVNRVPTGSQGWLLLPVALDPPNPNCVACGTATMHLHVNTNTFTLGDLVRRVLIPKIGTAAPSVSLGPRLLYEQGFGLEEEEIASFEAMAKKTLATCPGGGIRHGTDLQISDSVQEMSFVLSIHHRDLFDEEKEPEGFVLSGQAPVAAPEEPPAAPPSNGSPRKRARVEAEEEDDLVVVESAASASPRKRSRVQAEKKDEGDDAVVVL